MFGNIRFITFRIKHIILIVLICALAGVLYFSNGIIPASTTADVEDGAATAIRLPVIMYHSLLKDTSRSGQYTITPDQFEQDLKYLRAEGYTTVFLHDVIDYVYEGTPLPPKPIVLTFDDGHFNNKTYALPLLEKYDQKAVISIVGAYTDAYTEKPDENPNYAYLSWKNAQEVLDTGRIELQNHSYNMHTIGKRRGTHKVKGESDTHYRSTLIADVGKMQDLCKEHLNYTPVVFTYPFGSISLDSIDILKDMGFLASLSCGEGINKITTDPECLFLLKRCIRTSKRSLAQILTDYRSSL